MSKLAAAIIFALIGLASTAAHARRVALVIGNASYQVGPLANPVNDADAVAKAFAGLGFDKIIRATNATKAQMEKALAEVSDEAVGAEMAVVYFAGHGTERDGQNFLIPVDARLNRASDLGTQAVSLSVVLDQLSGASRLKLVILDACRNNVFPLQGAQRSVSRGLARVEPANNTLVLYAAKDGTTADDGTGQENSPFTKALIEHLPTPGLEIRFLLAAVRDSVLRATANKQEPFHYGALGLEAIYLKPPQGDAANAAAEIENARLRAEVERLRKERETAALAANANAATAISVVPPAQSQQTPTAPGGPDPAHSVVPGSGQSFRDCPECPEMVVVPAGSFVMGKPPSEERWPGYVGVEGPQHTVTIRQPFAVGKFEVTFVEWEACVAGGGCTSNRSPNDRGWGGGRRPVINVSWNDAKEYVEWLSRKTGKNYRLLTEAEWEYAARAGTTTTFYTGRTITTSQANFNGTSTYAGSARGEYRRKTTEVGSFPANPYGLHDMHGNVWESVEDCWHANYNGAPSDGSAWKTACTDEDRHVVRGGSWGDFPIYLRSAGRTWNTAGFRNVGLGLRVARTLY